MNHHKILDGYNNIGNMLQVHKGESRDFSGIRLLKLTVIFSDTRFDTKKVLSISIVHLILEKGGSLTLPNSGAMKLN